MRISTNLFHMQSFASIEKHQNSVLAIQEKLTTGQRVNRPSDDPIATSQINALNTTMNTLDQFAKNGDYAKSMLSYEETQMDSAVEATQRVRELTIQMMNETVRTNVGGTVLLMGVVHLGLAILVGLYLLVM